MRLPAPCALGSGKDPPSHSTSCFSASTPPHEIIEVNDHRPSDPHPLVDRAAAGGAESEANNEAPLGGFKIGFPSKKLQAPGAYEEHKNTQTPPRVNRLHILMFENFYFGRNLLNMVALEGLHRFLRPKAHEHWVTHMPELGFRVSPVTPGLQEEAYQLVQGLPDCFGLSIWQDAMALVVCGRPNVHVSWWTV